MLPTPSTGHVDVNHVYEPAEDSFLLLDTLSSAAESSFLKDRFGPDLESAKDAGQNVSPLIVEVGVGSGVVLAFLTRHANAILGTSDLVSLGVDINQYACKASCQTVDLACRGLSYGSCDGSDSLTTGLFMTSINGDLTSAIRPGAVDLLIFNPPYVPTSAVPQAIQPARDIVEGSKRREADEDAILISLSYAGGIDGMEVTDRLLEQLPLVLNTKRGVAYILLCAQNKPRDVAQRIRQWGSLWTVDIVGQSGKQGGWEKLQILRICRRR